MIFIQTELIHKAPVQMNPTFHIRWLQKNQNKRKLVKQEVCIDSSLAECSVPIPIPEKQRKPLTEIQEFNFLADQRAVERAEFDKKVITQILFLYTSDGSCLRFSMRPWESKAKLISSRFFSGIT